MSSIADSIAGTEATKATKAPIPWEKIIGVLTTVGVSYLIGAPLLMLLYSSVRSTRDRLPFESTSFTLDNHAVVFGSETTYRLFANTLIFAVGSVVLGLALAVGFAYLIERTNIPWRTLALVVVLAPMALSPFVAGIAWVLLANPKNGVLNVILRAAMGVSGNAPLDVYSITGMILVTGIMLVPSTYIMVSGTFSRMDPSLEEASRLSGAGTWQTLRRVTIPLLRPGILGATIYYFVVAVEIFEIPALLGIPSGNYLLSTWIYYLVYAPGHLPDYGLAAGFGMLTLLLAAVLIYIYSRMTRQRDRFVTVSGPGWRPQLIDVSDDQILWELVNPEGTCRPVSMAPASRPTTGDHQSVTGEELLMNVFDNVAYPLRYGVAKCLSDKEIRNRVMEVLRLVHMDHLAGRQATQMSGGQQQRVALARALSRRPKVFLLDEPLSNLDAKPREEMRVELRDLLRQLGTTSVYVTHDRLEALAMSDPIAVMLDGRVVQEGAPQDTYLRPQHAFVATFVGNINLSGRPGKGPIARVRVRGRNAPGADPLRLFRGDVRGAGGQGGGAPGEHFGGSRAVAGLAQRLRGADQSGDLPGVFRGRGGGGRGSSAESETTAPGHGAERGQRLRRASPGAVSSDVILAPTRGDYGVRLAAHWDDPP